MDLCDVLLEFVDVCAGCGLVQPVGGEGGTGFGVWGLGFGVWGLPDEKCLSVIEGDGSGIT